MKKSKLFKKVKTEHTILKDFIKLLQYIEKSDLVQRIIPWRISRQQKGSSALYVHFSYFTATWCKYNMSKWWTSQELFVVCREEDRESVKEYIQVFVGEL